MTKIRLNGTLITGRTPVQSLVTPASDLGTRIGIAKFAIEDLGKTLTTIPKNGDFVEILDDTLTDLRFAGLLKQIDRESAPVGRIYHCVAQDWNALLDVLYADITSSSAGLTDGWLAWSMVNLFAGPIAANPGFDYIRPAVLNLPAQTFARETLRARLDKIAVLAGSVPYWYDAAKQFHWNDVGQVAPYAVSTAPNEQAGSFRTYREEVLADAPVGYWRLGEASGTVAKDSSGNGRDGTYVGGVTLGAAGAVGDGNTAARFDGITGYVDLGDVAALKPAQVTVEVWYRSTDTDGMLVACPPTPYGYDIWVTVGSGLPRFEFDGALAAVTSITGPTSVSDGLWHHIVGTYDGAFARLYVDGVQVNSQAYNGGALEYAVGAVRINDRVGDVAYRVDGPIDEVAIYPTALSAARIAAHYAAGKVRLASMGDLRDFRDTTRAIERVTVNGSGGVSQVATDWPAHAASELVRLRENADPLLAGAASTRIPAVEITDTTIDTNARALQRGYLELARRGGRTVRFTTWRSGLQAGQVIDVVSANWRDADAKPLPRPAFRWRTQSRSGGLGGSLGRFLIQRVTPRSIGNGVTEYAIECGAYEPTLPSLLASKL